MRYYIFFLLLLAIAALPGQADKSQPSRWQAGLDFGLDLGRYANQFSSDPKGSQACQVELHYRVSRLLDLGAQLGYQRESRSGFQLTTIAALSQSVVLAWQSRRNNLYLGLQPRLNYRVGQGDLSASLSLGLVAHRSVYWAEAPLPLSLKVVNRRILDYYYQLNLGYTYWANPKFGIKVTLSRLRLEHATLTGRIDSENISGFDFDFYQPRSRTATNVEMTESDWSRIREAVDSATQVYLSLGVVYRPQ